MVDATTTVVVGNLVSVGIDIVGASGAWQLIAAGLAGGIVAAVGLFGAYKILKEVYNKYQQGEIEAGDTVEVSPA